MAKRKIEDNLSDSEIKMGPILKAMRFLGIHPKQPKTYLLFTSFHAILICGFAGGAMLLMGTADDVDTVMRAVETLLIYFWSMAKLLPVLFNMDKLNYLYDNLGKFWKSNDEAYYNLWIKTLMAFNVVSYILAYSVIYVIKPGVLVFDVYIPHYEYSYDIINITQKVQFLYKIPFIIIVDSFYFGLCFLIREQFTILIQELENCKDKRRLTVLSEHHAFLLEYSKILGEAYSGGLFIDYIKGVGGICAEFYFFDGKYAIIQTYLMGGAFRDKFFSVMLGGGLFIQLVLYCMLTAEITEKAAEIGDAAYFSEWYDLPVQDRKMIVFIIERAQSDLVFRAGGLFFIYRPALTLIFKNAYSIYTLAKNFVE